MLVSPSVRENVEPLPSHVILHLSEPPRLDRSHGAQQGAPLEFTSDESRTADAMAHYWGTFTTGGDPNAADEPVWPPYGDSQKWLSFGEVGKIEAISASVFVAEHHCAFWDRLAGTPFPFR